MKLEAAVIQGDGVGPEMMEEAVRVLQAVCRRFGHHLKLYPGKYQYPSCAYVSFFKMFFSLKSRTSGAGNGCCFCP